MQVQAERSVVKWVPKPFPPEKTHRFSPECLLISLCSGSGPVCSVDASNPNNVMLTCGVEYGSYTNQQINPIMTWKDSNGIVVLTDAPARSMLYDDNSGLQSATSLYSISSDDTKNYECQLNFSSPQTDLPDSIAKNAPNYTASCLAHCE